MLKSYEKIVQESGFRLCFLMPFREWDPLFLHSVREEFTIEDWISYRAHRKTKI